MNDHVVVLGGGIGGMSAAHELVERGFRVDVYELKNIPGGKSRTIPVPNSGVGGRQDLPGEHGFRFFPSFYVHLPDTMQRIPFGTSGKKTCFDNLVPTTRIELTRYDEPGIVTLSRFPTSLADLKVIFNDVFHADIGLAPGEAEFFAERIWQVMTSCEDRRMAELELLSWWDFVGAQTRSPAYKKFLAQGLSRSLVAARAEVGSARTVGQIQVRLYFGLLEPGSSADRVLNGPTSSAFLDPWLLYLRSRGVRYFEPWQATAIECVDGRIASVTVRNGKDGTEQRVEADWFVSALPVEELAPLVTQPMVQADPSLASVKGLAQNVAWMNGIQFFLKENVDVIHGHVLYVDSPWAITSISQAQFWPGYPIAAYGDGTVQGVLSVDISDWDAVGTFVKQKAKDCASKDDIAKEVWEELKRSLNVGGKTLLRDDMLHSYFLDSDIILPHPGRPQKDINLEPLFINKPDSWRLRPPAASRVSNLFLASDYVQTNSDLACMEAANEAARRAVNALLQRAGSPATPCKIWDMHMPLVLAPWRLHDEIRFKEGKPWDGRLLT